MERVRICREETAKIFSEQTDCADETIIDTYLYWEYGCAHMSRKIHASVSGRKYKRVGIAAAQFGGGIISLPVYSSTTDSCLFEF